VLEKPLDPFSRSVRDVDLRSRNCPDAGDVGDCRANCGKVRHCYGRTPYACADERHVDIPFGRQIYPNVTAMTAHGSAASLQSNVYKSPKA